ncbi:hypothetical protein EG850_11180 [Gulosibacter macacae]|uniref:Uncharacterized protein n=1 Tax=Gulosibacter macacae TaxID=2488791 RepID=A0A3P3VT17_9MICO|nr:hypothetical protein [Gulosibacter macacae]RRJ85941.1 hypothetical protein EG850_11180 [Gulosibacter macacae]
MITLISIPRPGVGLTDDAVAYLEGAGFTPEEWAKRHDDADGMWRGDYCGCPDDRCVGNHHAVDADCYCLISLVEEAMQERRAES